MKVIAEIPILKDDNIAEVTKKYKPNILTGPCTMQFRTNKTLFEKRLYIGSKRRVIIEGRQVYEYFNEPDTNNGNVPKWEIIKAEMNNPSEVIEEITLVISKNII